MKITLLISIASAFLMGAISVKAQENVTKMPVDPDTKKITYQEVVTVPGTPAELFNRAIEWINKQYKNPVDATKVRDQASGVIEILHRFELSRTEQGAKLIAGIVDYTMKLEMKDGRYRYTITNFNYKDKSRQPFERYLNKKDPAYVPMWDDYVKQSDDFTRKLIESLKQGMQPPPAKKNDQW